MFLKFYSHSVMYEGAPGCQNTILKPKSLAETLPALCLGYKQETVNGGGGKRAG